MDSRFYHVKNAPIRTLCAPLQLDGVTARYLVYALVTQCAQVRVPVRQCF